MMVLIETLLVLLVAHLVPCTKPKSIQQFLEFRSHISVLGGYIQADFSHSFFPPFFAELIFMRAGGKGASHGNLSLLFLIIKAVARVIFRSQDVAPPFDKLRLIEKLSLKLYWQLHVLSQDCIWDRSPGLLLHCHSLESERVYHISLAGDTHSTYSISVRPLKKYICVLGQLTRTFLCNLSKNKHKI